MDQEYGSDRHSECSFAVPTLALSEISIILRSTKYILICIRSRLKINIVSFVKFYDRYTKKTTLFILVLNGDNFHYEISYWQERIPCAKGIYI